jgi:glutamyl-tRNA synthetase
MTAPLPNDLIERLIPGNLPTIAELEQRFPQRQLPEGAWVTRVAPSPTGNMHIGTLYMALVNERLAHQSGGVFFLRVEDTDTKREVAGASEGVLRGLSQFGISFDEGPVDTQSEKGAYGSYYQSRRAEIYTACAKELLRLGKAYPCFCTAEELEDLRRGQESQGQPPGYYGKWAVGRNLTPDDIRRHLDAGCEYVIRMRSPGRPDKRIKFTDIIRGEREAPENDRDEVLLKSRANGGLPTYHFAHLVDDHFAGTTHVIRGDDWFSSVPLHLQLFDLIGWRRPKYGHLGTIDKLDEGKRRKLSKRKDPEAGVDSYIERGYPPEAVIEYLLNIANSNFEDWRKGNPDRSYADFALSAKKLSASGALFDFDKLDNISKNIISRLGVEQIYRRGLAWADAYSPDLAARMRQQEPYTRAILSIERTGPKIRKDLIRWSDLPQEIGYFFDDLFFLERAQVLALSGMPEAEVATLVRAFAASYDPADDRDRWFEKLKAVAAAAGYAPSPKEQQASPASFKGNVSDVAKVLRILMTGRAQTPDLHSVMTVLGVARVQKRLELFK